MKTIGFTNRLFGTWTEIDESGASTFGFAVAVDSTKPGQVA